MMTGFRKASEFISRIRLAKSLDRVFGKGAAELEERLDETSESHQNHGRPQTGTRKTQPALGRYLTE